MSLPWQPLPCHSGYFMMVNIRNCAHLIPKVYFETHDYENSEPKIIKNHLYMPKKSPDEPFKIPLDLAFSRWMAKENGVTMMPGSFFYHKHSPYINDGYVRLAICKNLESVKQVCKRLRQIKIWFSITSTIIWHSQSYHLQIFQNKSQQILLDYSIILIFDIY